MNDSEAATLRGGVQDHGPGETGHAECGFAGSAVSDAHRESGARGAAQLKETATSAGRIAAAPSVSGVQSVQGGTMRIRRRVQADAKDIGRVLKKILDLPVPPVARCRLLSSGFSATHMLNVSVRLEGSRACLGCGNCIDVCGLLSREPKRLNRTAQRSSMALETMVEKDCDRCDNCVLACPQVDTTIKHHIVSGKMVEQMERLLEMASADETDWFDWHAGAETGLDGE